MDAERLLDDLDDDQRRAVTTAAAPLCIVAPAGSGKTRVLTRRIARRVADGDADPRRVLALTFTRQAAAELGARLARAGLRDPVTAGTFHAVAYATLRARWADRRQSPPVLLERSTQLLTDIVPSGGRGSRAAILRAVAGEIEWAQARMIAPDAYPDAAFRARRRTGLPAATVAQAFAGYLRAKHDSGLVDFDDLLALCAHALEQDERFAAAQRWRFRHLFVDELQDANPLQLRLLEAWRAGRDDVCGVGDPRQAIYGFNGSDPGFLQRIERHWLGVEVIELRHSYRSTPQILAAATAVLGAQAASAAGGVATRGDGDAVSVQGHADDRAEALALARGVRLARRPGRPWADQAILVRTHAQMPLIAEALRAEHIPHRAAGETVTADPAVRAVLDRLRGTPGPLGRALVDLSLDGQSAGAGTESPGSSGPGRDRHTPADTEAALALVADLGAEFGRLAPDADGEAFVRWLLASSRPEPASARRDEVTLATFHAAKGLEWPIVHLAGFEEGLVPIAHARTSAARAEEVRLAHVAMTRAAEVLRVHWASRRTLGGKQVERTRSSLLDTLAPTGSADAPSPSAEAGPDRDDASASAIEVARRSLADAAARKDAEPARGRPGPPDPMQLASLRRWRASAARGASVDAEAVLRDDVLVRVARQRPTDVDSLGRIPGVGPVLARRLGPGLLAALGGCA